jgi:hypothetical protein
VREAVAARGGKILAGRSDEGGTSVLMVLPTGDQEALSGDWAGNRRDPHEGSAGTSSLRRDGSYR